MASKYAGLKGKVPQVQPEPSDREQKIQAWIAERMQPTEPGVEPKTLQEITAEYNNLVSVGDELGTRVWTNNLHQEAAERLVQQLMNESGADSLGMHGFTWSQKFLPIAVSKDANVEEIKTFFKENGMEDQLELKTSELATRLNAFVKEEAENNELDIGTRTYTDHEGVEHTVPDVKSKIPGVRVLLKATLSRVKSSKKGAQ